MISVPILHVSGVSQANIPFRIGIGWVARFVGRLSIRVVVSWVGSSMLWCGRRSSSEKQRQEGESHYSWDIITSWCFDCLRKPDDVKRLNSGEGARNYQKRPSLVGNTS
jgi:hypothetical protein